jgi:hypothetical protein
VTTRRFGSPTDSRGALGYLVAVGVARASDLSDPRVRIADWSRSHTVLSVRLGDGRHVVVKRARPRPGERFGNIDAELAAYEEHAGNAAWAELAPPCLAVDRARQILVSEAVEPGTSLLRRTWFGSGLGEVELAQVGERLGRWHRSTTGSAHISSIRDPAWVLDVLSPGHWRPAVTDRLLAHGQVRRRLRTSLAHAAAALEPSCVVHGDLKWDHCLIEGATRVRIVDWETTSAGDPAWDVAGILQDHIAAAIADPAARWPASTAEAFVDAYLAASATRRPQAFRIRASSLAGARLVQTALETVAADERLARDLLEAALRVFEDPNRPFAVISRRG